MAVYFKGGIAQLAAALALSFPVSAETVQGTVTRVIDGDTVVVVSKGRPTTVRIQGIDAPEKHQTGGDASKQNMKRLADGKRVTMETQKRPDKYGRTVAKVTADGKDVGLEQIKQGQAQHYKKYQSKQSAKDRRTYSAADRKAPKPSKALSPEEFRRNNHH